jgi:metallo-beta-lactamase family protein
MTVSLSFCGAAGTVTGSCYLIHHPGGRFLVDCGMFQGPKTLKALNYGAFPFDPARIDFVLLTHAHIDHSGLLPKLTRLGFAGHVITTAGTRDLLSFMLPDSAQIQEAEVERLNRRNQQRSREPVQPIYGRADAEAALSQVAAVGFERWIECGPGVRARFWNAGHILGAASIEVEIATGDTRRRFVRLLFSGDLGPGHKIFHPDPDAPENFDYLVVESTYGDRDRPEITAAARREALRKEVSAALQRGGNLLIPCFAVERTQELLFDLGRLFATGALPRARLFLDSPLAIRATQVFALHARDLEDIGDVPDPFQQPNFHFVETVEQSKAIGRIQGGAIIIAASGMCDAGRIRHHLKQNLWRPDATVLFVGYQAPGTLGSLIEGGVKAVRIHGEEVSVQAAIRRLDAYSGHADRAELIAWVKERLPVSRAIFLTHGEEAALAALKEGLVAIGCAPARVVIPRLDDRVRLDGEAETPRPEATQPRLPPEAVGRPDWHNAYAALTIDLQHRLNELGDDRARNHLLARVRAALDGGGA